MERLILGVRRLGFSLSPHQVASFQTYYEELVRWNSRMNLTAIVDYEEVQTRHFLDSLTVALCLEDKPLAVLDVGTGAGFPGIPLKILLPHIKLFLLESVTKKALFLNHLVTTLGLQEVEVLHGRAEDLARDEGYREGFNVVLSRGVARLAVLLELTLPFCAVGGISIAQRKGKVEQEVEAAAGVISVLGGRLRDLRWIKLDELGQDRALVIIEKCAATPHVYPRRAGMPQKRPLGSKEKKVEQPCR